jgi:heme/copper-type cytochrome/quinol oxidase subunit 3
MTALAAPATPANPHRETGWWAMACVCATEAAFFAYLITAYFYLDMRSPRWPPAGVASPELLVPSIMTVVLLMGSAAMAWSERAVRRNEPAPLRTALTASILLGCTFLALFAVEYHGQLQHLLPRDHAYASMFYIITGVHGMHVTFGVLLVGYALLRTLRASSDRPPALVIANAALYWHFVDLVWLGIMAVVYLSPRLR